MEQFYAIEQDREDQFDDCSEPACSFNDEFFKELKKSHAVEGKALPELHLLAEANELSRPDKLGTLTEFEQACAKFEKAILITSKTNVTELRRAYRALMKAQFLDEAELNRLLKKTEAPSSIRLQYALLLNAWGIEKNDQTAKEKAIEVLKDIKNVDKHTFDGSAPMQGALIQAEEGRMINPATAPVEAFYRAAAFYLDFPRRFFNPSDAERSNAVRCLREAYLFNEEATDAHIEKEVQKLYYSWDKRYLRAVAAEAKQLASADR
jgi:hypothetical protein